MIIRFGKFVVQWFAGCHRYHAPVRNGVKMNQHAQVLLTNYGVESQLDCILLHLHVLISRPPPYHAGATLFVQSTAKAA